MMCVTSRKLTLICLLIFWASAAYSELPNEQLVCPADDPKLSKTEYLRALSLDLRGTVPTVPEYQALIDEEDVPESLIDKWLAEPAFGERVARFHRSLLWNNITNIQLLSASTALRRDSGLYWARNRAQVFRGGIAPCLDEPVKYDANGTIATTSGVFDGVAVNQEGYVMVAPYWAPDTLIKVCAFDAQTTLAGPDGVQCGTSAAFQSEHCGCGAELRWCRYGPVSQNVTAAMGAEIERRIQDMIVENRPYTDFLTERRMYINGPLSFYLRNQTSVPANVRVTPLSFPIDSVPTIPYTEFENWQLMELPKHHAGVLTSMAFLMRFQTNRARATQYYNAFLCQPFQPPATGIPLGDGTTLQHPDLQVRDGCKYCHALLEPAGSYWGRWSENGAGFLDPMEYTPFRKDCETCALTGLGCTSQCRREYKVSALSPEEVPYLGWLMSYEFRRPEHEKNVELGPRLLALSSTVDHRMPKCVSYTAANWLLGRTLHKSESSWLEQLAVDFVSKGYSYRELVKAVVTSDVYRRIR